MDFGSPVTASDGIHDSDRTDVSIRMAGPSPWFRLGCSGSCPVATVRLRAGWGEGDSPGAVGVPAPPRCGSRATLREGGGERSMGDMQGDGADAITVFLADDNVIVREGVRALLALEPDLTIVGTAGDYDELIAGAEAAAPQVLVTDIRMTPAFQREGIDAAKELRKRHPGTGVVVLSQYDDPEYAVSLLADGSSGYGYLLKDRLAEGDQLVQAV